MNGVDALDGRTRSEVEVDGGVAISPTMPCTASVAIATSTCHPTNPV